MIKNSMNVFFFQARLSLTVQSHLMYIKTYTLIFDEGAWNFFNKKCNKSVNQG